MTKRYIHLLGMLSFGLILVIYFQNCGEPMKATDLQSPADFEIAPPNSESNGSTDNSSNEVIEPCAYDIQDIILNASELRINNGAIATNLTDIGPLSLNSLETDGLEFAGRHTQPIEGQDARVMLASSFHQLVLSDGSRVEIATSDTHVSIIPTSVIILEDGLSYVLVAQAPQAGWQTLVEAEADGSCSLKLILEGEFIPSVSSPSSQEDGSDSG